MISYPHWQLNIPQSQPYHWDLSKAPCELNKMVQNESSLSQDELFRPSAQTPLNQVIVRYREKNTVCGDKSYPHEHSCCLIGECARRHYSILQLPRRCYVLCLHAQWEKG